MPPPRRNTGESVRDSLLIAMVLKGLRDTYKAFEVVITQSHEVVTFADFKVSLKNFDDTENARKSPENERGDAVMYSSDSRHSGGFKNGARGTRGTLGKSAIISQNELFHIQS